MNSVTTVSCKLAVTPEQAQKIDATLQAFADACNFINQETPDSLTNKIALQALIYQTVRAEFGLSANLAIQAVRRVAANRKAVGREKVKVFRPSSASYDQRIFSLRQKDWTVSLTLIGGRERFRLLIGNYQFDLLKDIEPTSATLCKRKDGSYYLQIVRSLEAPPATDSFKALGVDLGRRKIAVTRDGEQFSSEAINQVRESNAALRAKLQAKAPKGTRSTRRRCRELQKRLSGRERRFQRHVNHVISRRLVDQAKESGRAIALEDLTGIRQRTNQQPRNKTERRRNNSWAFYQLRAFIQYKAIAAGVPVWIIQPAYTSQTCNECLHIGTRRDESFYCDNGQCDYAGDADHNAAIVISRLAEAVILPGGPDLACPV